MELLGIQTIQYCFHRILLTAEFFGSFMFSFYFGLSILMQVGFALHRTHNICALCAVCLCKCFFFPMFFVRSFVRWFIRLCLLPSSRHKETIYMYFFPIKQYKCWYGAFENKTKIQEKRRHTAKSACLWQHTFWPWSDYQQFMVWVFFFLFSFVFPFCMRVFLDVFFFYFFQNQAACDLDYVILPILRKTFQFCTYRTHHLLAAIVLHLSKGSRKKKKPTNQMRNAHEKILTGVRRSGSFLTNL